jgi:uncharacterized membrane protein/cytochrome c-type biogenesis protein CcmH/NrfF
LKIDALWDAWGEGMTQLAVISMGRPDWLIPAIAIVVVGIIVVGRACKRTDVDRRTQLLAATFKFVGLALLAACLVEPVWSDVQPKPHSNMFLLLVDNSQSLNVRNKAVTAVDEAEDNTAHESNSKPDGKTPSPRSAKLDTDQTLASDVRKLLKEDKAVWWKRLEQDFDFHQFAFDRRIRHVADASVLKWDGDQSGLRNAITSIAERFQGQPVGGVILLTDGNATDLRLDEVEKLVTQTKGIPPLYPVVFDRSEHRADIAIAGISVSQTPFEDAPVSLQCNVTAFGLQSITDWRIVCKLTNELGQTVEVQRLPIVSAEKPVAFRFQMRPEKLGTSFYRVSTFAESTKTNTAGASDEGNSDEPEKLEEATTRNNTRLVQVDRGTRKHRILYVCGRPNWEFKFLQRSLKEDEQVELTAIIRVAKREAKFVFRGRDGQDSNSIFRGFKKAADAETERYDQPVLIRLNTRDKDEMRDGFPKDPEKLFEFDALVLDDIEAEFFNQDQLAIIGQFVSERGGSLLMLGGQESFQSGGYQRTTVGELLPVYLDRAHAPQEDTPLSLDLTREGWLQPWVRLRANEVDERKRLGEMPSFRTLNPTDGIKPGASVMTSVSDGSGRHWPALVTQKFGRGRSAAMLIGDLWRWQLNKSEDDPDDLAKAWRQTMRWLVADVPHRVEVTTVPANDGPNSVKFRVKVSDKDYKPLENARVRITVGPVGFAEIETPTKTNNEANKPKLGILRKDDRKSDPEPNAEEAKPAADLPEESEKKTSKDIVLIAEPSLDEAGVYEVVFVPQTAGAWKVKAEAISSDGEELVADESGWVVESSVSEFHSIGTNHALLESLARETGGEMIHESMLDSFVTRLKSKPMPVMEAWTMPLWDQPIVFLIVVACFVAEWGLRRRRGLP